MTRLWHPRRVKNLLDFFSLVHFFSGPLFFLFDPPRMPYAVWSSGDFKDPKYGLRVR